MTGNCSEFSPDPAKIAANAYNEPVCGACRALYFLEPMLIEPGLGISLGERDHLASDEPNIKLPLPT
jgi:hypothetical protein